MKKVSKKVRIILVAALVLALLTGAAGVMTSHATVGENVVQTLLTPLRGAAAAMTRQAERLYNYVYGYETLEAENKMLRQRIADMEQEASRAESLQRENDRLNALLDITAQNTDYKFAGAYITNRDGSSWGDAFTVGRGSAAGIETGMCAVTQYGQVVGVVTETGLNWATVTTILDSSSQISAMLSVSGYTGIVQGSYQSQGQGDLRMNYLPTDSVLKNNELVVTTGTARYPKGLTIGYIAGAGLDETGVAKYAALTPAADFSSLEEVFVLTDYQSN
ncbi:MAG: rod shape-determining protein MreC [Oscillospiraceae bacterium]|nr:rod shape-determining protein MreC [Oscillospiraceae bacterium]